MLGHAAGLLPGAQQEGPVGGAQVLHAHVPAFDPHGAVSLRDRLARAGDGQQAGALSGGAGRALGQSADDDITVQDRRGA